MAGGKEIRIKGKWLRIADLDSDGFDFLDDPEAMLEALRRSGTKVDLFTFLQRLPESAPKYSYPMEWDNLAAIPVSTFDEWWTKQIGFKARNKAKQAEKKGVVVREVPFNEEFVRGIWEIYNESAVRQGRRFPHYGKDFETVYKEEATYLEDSVFIGAFLEEKLIGFVKLVSDRTRTQAALMNILSLIQQRDKAPTNALIAHAVRVCASQGISYLVYSNFAYGKKQTDGIMAFKEANGFKKMDLPRYYVPLTLRGRIAFRWRLHHRFIDHLPESVVGRVRDFRNSWYNRKFQTAKESA